MNRRKPRAGAPTSQSIGGVELPDALYEAGLAHMQAERFLDAQLCCQQALAADPDHADTLHLVGLLSLPRQTIRSRGGVDRARDRARSEAGISCEPGNRAAAAGTARGGAEGVRQGSAAQAGRCGVMAMLGGILVRARTLGSCAPELSACAQAQSAPSGRCLQERAFSCIISGGSKRLWPTLICCDEVLPNHAPTLRGRVRALYYLNRFEEALADSRRVTRSILATPTTATISATRCGRLAGMKRPWHGSTRPSRSDRTWWRPSKQDNLAG